MEWWKEGQVSLVGFFPVEMMKKVVNTSLVDLYTFTFVLCISSEQYNWSKMSLLTMANSISVDTDCVKYLSLSGTFIGRSAR